MSTPRSPSEPTGASAGSSPLVSVRDLHITFTLSGRRTLHAVDGVSFDLHRGETFGVIGESGSGKSTLGRAIIGLERARSGTVHVDGNAHGEMTARRRRRLAHRVQMIFQDSIDALDPHLCAAESVAEPLLVGRRGSGAQVRSRVHELLEMVGLSTRQGKQRPNELSGGQRQRVSIARALALDPDVLICDEAVSALDVSLQAEILNLLKDLQRDKDLTYLFISHDIGVVSRICDRVGVMYLGRLVEVADSGQLVQRPLHPYTEALLSAEPQALPSRLRNRRRVVLAGEMPSPTDPPTGCRFRTRCRYARDRCASDPAMRVFAGERSVACHFAEELRLGGTPLDSGAGDPAPTQKGTST